MSTREGARRANILIVSALMQHPVRDAVADHLTAFDEHSAHRVFHLNLLVQQVPRALLRVPFGLVVFHTSFVAQRWAPPTFALVRRRAEPLKKIPATRVALPQDEFLATDLLAEFINDFDIDHVFSAAAESEWPKIYAAIDRDRVGISRALTGYVAPRTARRLERAAQRTARTVDVAYRAYAAPPWLGRLGSLKREIADVFAAAAPRGDLVADISTRDEDALFGAAWHRFYARSRYVLGVEGGASILDHDASIRASVERYCAEHPRASFEEVEAACFPGRDGELDLRAISPRHFEACAARTCQVLVRGDYNGILEAGRHYIPVEPDFSNVGDVLDSLRDEALRLRITEAAYEDVIASGRYGYDALVREVEAVAPALEEPAAGVAVGAAALARNRLARRRGGLKMALMVRLGGPALRLARRLRIVPAGYDPLA